jgi:hypothetical protein
MFQNYYPLISQLVISLDRCLLCHYTNFHGPMTDAVGEDWEEALR